MQPQFILFAAAGTLALAACQSADGGSSASSRGMQSAQTRFAESALPPRVVADVCAGCHAVERGALSPLPDAPSFASIANREGLTSETLAAYLRDAHNYPDIMDVGLDDEDVALVTAHIISLQDADYRRPPS